MYTSFGEYLIVERAPDKEQNSCGIIIQRDAPSIPRFKVICPPANYLDLKDRIIIAVNEQVVMMLPDNKHYTINFNNIVAVED
jgi:hypothetical protein